MQALISRSAPATAVTIAADLIKKRKGVEPAWEESALRLAVCPELIRANHIASYQWREVAISLLGSHSADICQAILEQHVSSGAGSYWFAKHSQAAEVLRRAAVEQPEKFWAALMPKLEDPATRGRFSIGFPTGLLEHVPWNSIEAWIVQSAEERGPLIARLVSKDFGSDDAQASRLIAQFGDIRAVDSAMLSSYMSGSWAGPASEHWNDLAASLEEVASRTNLFKLRSWARSAALYLREMAVRELEREQEEDAH